jgi:hypothetical protein
MAGGACADREDQAELVEVGLVPGDGLAAADGRAVQSVWRGGVCGWTAGCSGAVQCRAVAVWLYGCGGEEDKAGAFSSFPVPWVINWLTK